MNVLGESAHDTPGGTFISRRVIARQLRRLVICRRCDRQVSLSHTLARNCVDGYVPAEFTRILLSFYNWLISDTIDFPQLFFAVSTQAIVERRGVVYWNSRSGRS